MPIQYRTPHNFLDVPHDGGTTFDPKEDKTRQEFAKEADANWLLKKYGAGFPMASVQYGEQDFDIDLLTARSQVSRLAAAYAALPEDVRAKYPSWADVVSAIEAGVDPFKASVEAPKTAPEAGKE